MAKKSTIVRPKRSDYDTLVPVRNRQELETIAPGRELVLAHFGIAGRNSFTIHGTFVNLSAPFIDLEDHLSLPIQLNFVEDDNLALKYLRNAANEHYPRISPALGFNFFLNPGEHNRIYTVHYTSKTQ